MTDDTRTRWREVQEGYAAARKIAVALWPADTPPEVLQAATATLLIEFGNRRSAPAASSPAPVRVPGNCPDCGGAIYDNRADKASGRLPAKRPDFKCKNCDWARWPARKPLTLNDRSHP